MPLLDERMLAAAGIPFAEKFADRAVSAAQGADELLRGLAAAEINPEDWKPNVSSAQIFRTQLADGRKITLIIEPPQK